MTTGASKATRSPKSARATTSTRATKSQGPPKPQRPWVLIAVVIIGVVVVGLVYAEPIQDGDLFWQMAYGRQMLDRHTLIPDHSLYSWMPASNRTIYCAWTAELFLLGIFNLAGTAGLFVLRYAVVIAILVLLWRYARRVGLGRSPLTALALLIVALAGKGGTIIKPELFSFLLFNATVFVFLRARLIAREGGDARRWLVAVPLIMVLWVNSHGAFLLAAPFLLAAGVGELLSARFSPATAMPRGQRHWLIGCLAACLLAVNLTPYGPAYPMQLIGDYIFGRQRRPDTAWNVAHLPIWDSSVLGLHLVEYGLLMVALLGVAFVLVRVQRQAPVDWTLVLATIAYLPLYVFQLRTTYFFPVVFAYSLLTLLANKRRADAGRKQAGAVATHRPAVAALATVTFMALGARAAYATYAAPPAGSWLGFGTSYVNPVVETAYVEREGLGPRLYNIFDSGGYLLSELYPRNQVMVDSRSFPFLSWFPEQFDFANGRSVARFIARYPADVAVLDLLKDRTWLAFLQMDDWRLVFYGPTAAVLVRDPTAQLMAGSDPRWAWVGDLRNASSALNAFEFASFVGDFPTAWAILDQLRGPLAHQLGEKDRRQNAYDYQAAYDLLRRGRSDQAEGLLRSSLARRPMSTRDDVVLGLLARLRSASSASQSAPRADVERTLRELAGPASIESPTRAQ